LNDDSNHLLASEILHCLSATVMYNQYRLSLIHKQLKVGTANQRHPSHQPRFFSAQFNTKKKEHNNGRNRNSKVV
jgi:hypothetical protein